MTVLVWLLPAAACAYLFLIVPTMWLKVERVRIPAGLGIKILQISDLHVEKLRVPPGRLTRLIDAEKPDYIALTGDFTRRSKYLPKVEKVLKAVASRGIPAFAVLGNHDHRLDPAGMRKLSAILDEAGIALLNNGSADLGAFQFVGVDDLGTGHSRIGKAFRHTAAHKPVVVLTHDPNLVLRLKRPFTYLMAGHFHGMQFYVPFLFRFIRKGELAARGITKGLHETSYGRYYISKGIGQAGPNARFMIRSEVTVHEL
ncbi:metallophosphoesterase [Paenibacillus chitinolyticus]|uniref:metallophosphoesterase n=1 Tax=Paenibacillus chitinolyticus TaxID=79263 RepID=UPI002DBE324B|nr:metallophosphoesterase [Paenibacillus chitinolyticus]MEC0249389.1 metallophosphoesterase [Paenibacillus chitinolyticus]